MMEKQKKSQAPALLRQFTVRAIPLRGHSRRFRAGRGWTKEPIVVTVVDRPAPPMEERDRDGKKYLVYSDEITPADLAQLQSDPQIAVIPVGEAGAESIEVNALKAEFAELQAELEKARKKVADHAELIGVAREASQKQAEAAAAKIALLESELAQLRAHVAKMTATAAAT